MNRELRVKAWRTKAKVMSPVWTMLDVITFSGAAGGLANSDEVIWLQLVGLRDSEGKEVCEGDIVSGFDGLVGVIKWSNEDAAFVFSSKTGGAMLCQQYLDNFEIIGNIYQNPELIK